MNRILTIERNQEKSWVKDLLLVLAGGFFISLFANISISLPFTPVPIATQAHVCLFLAVVLGARRGALAVLTFLMQGALGMPVFALGKSGFLHLLGPTGGYLIGYLAAAYLVGFIVERNHGLLTPVKLFSIMALGNLVIFALGIPHLSLFIGLKSALIYGFLPFILGDLLKLLVSVQFLKRLRGALDSHAL
jgi:biotin transport system substrate-specific component